MENAFNTIEQDVVKGITETGFYIRGQGIPVEGALELCDILLKQWCAIRAVLTVVSIENKDAPDKWMTKCRDNPLVLQKVVGLIHTIHIYQMSGAVGFREALMDGVYEMYKLPTHWVDDFNDIMTEDDWEEALFNAVGERICSLCGVDKNPRILFSIQILVLDTLRATHRGNASRSKASTKEAAAERAGNTGSSAGCGLLLFVLGSACCALALCGATLLMR